MDETVGNIGRKTISLVNHIGKLCAFFYRLVRLFFEHPREGRQVIRWGTVEQIYFTGWQALPIIIPTSLIAGSMLIVQFAKLSGQYDLAKIVILLVVRELGPMITALVVILRSASAVTIEISYMKVLNEIETLELAGIDPLRIICLPRLKGITLSMLCLFVVFDLVSILGGYLIVWVGTYLPVANLLEQIAKAITISDIAVGIVKALCFGVTITIVSLYHGFASERQMTQIPQVTSKAAVECFIFCLVISIFISTVFYL